jgi:hypothetical protein
MNRKRALLTGKRGAIIIEHTNNHLISFGYNTLFFRRFTAAAFPEFSFGFRFRGSCNFFGSLSRTKASP